MRRITINQALTRKEADSFSQYLKNLYDIKLLTPKEEKELIERIENGDKTAINELIERNLRFVVSVAKKYVSGNIPLEDLVNEGNIGLIIAANKYDPKTGYRFISYAVWWIQKSIMEYLSKYGKTIKLPANKINDVTKLEKQRHELEQKYGRKVDINEIIQEYGSKDFDSDYYYKLNDLTTFNVASLDVEIDSDSETSSTHLEMLYDDDEEETDNLLIKSDIKSDINKLLNHLSPRDKQIMVALYGLDGNIPQNLNDVGEQLNPPLTRERIRQIKNNALKILKNKLKHHN